LTVSNAPDISRESKDATCLLEPHIVRTCDVSRSSAISVDLFLRPPICASSSRLCFSARSWIRLAVKDSMSFPIVLSKAIGLYALGLSYELLLGLQITAVQASLNLAR
jgi:hypothetical protein